MGAPAVIGAGGMVAGTGLNAYGEEQGLRAMRNVWGDELAQQQGYDQRIAGRTQQLLDQVDPSGVTGTAQAQQLQRQLDTSNRTVANAVQSVAARRGGGGAEGQAAAAQANSGVLARALQADRIQSFLAGLQNGGQNLDILGRAYSLDTGRIRSDARDAASLAPLYERAAGMNGLWARQLGEDLRQAGTMGVMAGLSAPAGGGGMGGPGEVPAGPNGGPEALTAYQQDVWGGSAPTFSDYMLAH